MIRALIFDFDGLILDTEVAIYRAWADVYEEHGQQLPASTWATIVGRRDHFDPMEELEDRLGRRLDRRAISERRVRRRDEVLAALPVLPGVREWQAEAAAQGMALGVASNSSRRWVAGHLARLGLDGWACVRCADDVERPKPAPDVYLAVLGCLGVSAAEAIAVEDSESGVAAAKAARLYCVAVPSALTAGHDLSAADLVLGSLADATLSEVAARAARA